MGLREVHVFSRSDGLVMGSSSLTWGTAIGIVLGVAYAASPLTVWFVLVMIGLFAWAGRGLTDRERRHVWGILAVAVMIRGLAVAALFLTSNHYVPVSFVWDGDGVYLKMRAMVIRNGWLGIPNYPYDVFRAFQRSYGWSPYLYVLAYLQYLTGPAPYGVHLFNVTMYLAAAVVMHRLVRSAYGKASALLGLALMVFLPTLISWSVSALKEALYIFLCAVALMAVVTALRASRMWERAFGIALLAGAIAANSAVRAGASVIMIVGIVSGLAGNIVVRRVGLVVLFLTLVPFVVLGLRDNAGVQAWTMFQLKVSAARQVGNVKTPGHHYKLLDRRIYSGDPDDPAATMTAAEGRRFVVRALLSIVFVPLPWQVESVPEMIFLAEQVIWYLLVVFACVGLVAGLRRDALVTCMLAGLSAAGAAVIAFNSGNIGTMVRLRDTIVPFVLWLSAVGMVATVSTLYKESTPCL